MSSRAVMSRLAGSATSPAGVHGHTRRTNSGSAVQMVPIPHWTP